MKLLQLHIQNFGTLHDVSMEFSSGCTTLCRENGWGKSTLAVFLKAMLYGLPASSKRSLEENERKKYAPWQGGAFGGSITFSSDRGTFRAERFFGAKESEDSFALYDLSTNLPSAAYPPELGNALFGIDADGFERTVYFPQRTLKGKIDNSSISAKLGNLLDDPDDIGNYDRALELLEKRRKYYILTGNRGKIADLEREWNDRAREIEETRRQVLALEEKEAELKKTEESLRELREEENILRENQKKALLSRNRATVLQQKKQMEEEIFRLEKRQAELNRLLGGVHPDDAELSRARACLSDLRKARGAVELLEKPCAEEETLLRLSRKYPNGLPDADAARELSKKKDALRDAVQEEKLLSGGQEILTGTRPAPIPEDKLLAALATAEQLDALRKEVQAARTNRKQSRSRILSALLIAAALVLTALSLLPALQQLRLPLLSAGGCALLAGAILLFLPTRKSSTSPGSAEDAEKELLLPVRDLLSSRGIFPAEGEEMQALKHLADEERTRRASAQKEEQVRQNATQKKKALARELYDMLLCYFPSPFPLQEMQSRTEQILHDAESARLAKEASLRREKERQHAAAEHISQQQNLQRFLQRFPKEEAASLEERLAMIAAWESEFRRNLVPLQEKKAELQRFTAEKQELLSATEDPADYSRLCEDEQELQNRLRSGEEKKAALRQTIRRLSDNTDRLPDLLSQQEELQNRLQEAQKAGKTLENTIRLLQTAKQSLSTRYLSSMQESFDRYLTMLSAAGADTVPESAIDASFDVFLRVEGKTRAAECFSRGWQDMLRFCLRLSLVSALYREGEKPFLLLDDPFVNLDDRRLTAAQQLLGALSEEYQILYLVCRKERRL